MTEADHESAVPLQPKPGDEMPLQAAILFVDLVSSSEFASVLSFREYAHYVNSFTRICREQCDYFFNTICKGRFQFGFDYRHGAVGDELVVFMHTGKPQNDVYLLINLAISLKCAWLGSQVNADRIRNGRQSTELACGINFGTVWADVTEDGYDLCGYAINLGKRVESASRTGQHFRIFLSDAAFKQINRKMRNLLFSSRIMLPLKGVVLPIAVYELVESFANPEHRLAPHLLENFSAVAPLALRTNSLDLWIHSCWQMMMEGRNGAITDHCLQVCLEVLKIEPTNPLALYQASEAHLQNDNLETAVMFQEDLLKHWPQFADGWLSYGRALKKLGKIEPARQAILHARRHGVGIEEEPLPSDTPNDDNTTTDA